MSQDPRIQAAVDHWGPRYIENGVPPGDFFTVAKTCESWDDWCRAWSEVAAQHEAEGDAALAAGHTQSAAYHFVTAAVEYHFGKFLFVHDLDQMRTAHMKAVAAHRKAHPYMRPPVERVEFPYLDGHTLVGHLRKPEGVERPPVVLMMPGLDSAKEELSSNEQWFLDRGMATFLIDGPGQGEAEYELAMEPHYEKPASAAIDALEARDDLDTDRLGAWGVSLGGYYVMRATACEPRIKAYISLSGPFSIPQVIDRMPPLSQKAFTVRTHSSSLEEAKEKLQTMDLTDVIGQISVPGYIVAGSEDRVIPGPEAQRMADGVSGPVILDVVEGGSHVVSNLAWRYRPHVADWMAEQLQASG
jgi:dienelactone hydrolase